MVYLIVMSMPQPESALETPSTTPWRSAVFVFVLCGIYALLRYSFFGPVEPQHWPTYISNKAISVFAVCMLALSGWNYAKGYTLRSKQQGRMVWHAALIHSGLSLALLNGDYYPKFFADNGMNFLGESVILCGVLASYALWQVGNLCGLRHHQFKCLACALALLHLLPMSASWITPMQWYGFMPPMSLISALAAGTALLLYWRYRQPDQSNQKT
ncbi:MAG: hypothetical protein CL693_12465 [Cellvibrionaceae bacterium]|nr:hypothetical protein [Cellvibrionaceae bacterium]|tara:strand:+ start:380 stop:1021 length:642 start_codon:yes stop_codon:yes gene_type:complete